MIYKNKNICGYTHNIVFGIVECLDGLLRIVSFGRLCSTMVIDCARTAVKKHFQKLKESNAK